MIKILKIGFLLVIIALLIISAVFSYKKLSDTKCQEIKVVMTNGSYQFVNENDIREQVISIDSLILKKNIRQINTESIETGLEKISAIENAEVYDEIFGCPWKFQGRLIVRVLQRTPVFRVISESGNFFVDYYGEKIGMTPEKIKKMIIVTGFLENSDDIEKMLPFIHYISEDDFWKSQIQQIYRSKNGEIKMIPLIGNQVIEFGDVDNYMEKFRNLKALYEQGFSKTGWQRYSNINLKFKNQIVCTKNKNYDEK